MGEQSVGMRVRLRTFVGDVGDGRGHVDKG